MSDVYGGRLNKQTYRKKSTTESNTWCASVEADKQLTSIRRAREHNLSKPCKYYMVNVGSKECGRMRGASRLFCRECNEPKEEIHGQDN